jgi:DNA-binding CsgD family transcriptional regulator
VLTAPLFRTVAAAVWQRLPEPPRFNERSSAWSDRRAPKRTDPEATARRARISRGLTYQERSVQAAKAPDLDRLARAAFDGVHSPMMVCDKWLRVLLGNRSARALCDVAEFVWERGSVIQCHAESVVALRTAVRETLRTGDPSVVRIPDVQKRTSMGCRISRLEMPAGAVYAFLEFEAAHMHCSRADISALGSLTSAERHVATLLITGATLRHICKVRGTSLNTVKTQVRQVLQKTHTGRKVELMALFTANEEASVVSSTRPYART